MKSVGNKRFQPKAKKKVLTRKEIRKQKQEQKKENKRIFFSNKSHAKQSIAGAAPAKQSKAISNVNSKPGKPLVLAPTPSPKRLKINQVADEDNESITSVESGGEETVTPAKAKRTNLPKQKQAATRPDPSAQRQRELKRQKDIQRAAGKQRIKQLKLENEEEERQIAKLEKKLKLNKSKDKIRSVRKMFDDGLDYALELFWDDDEAKEKERKALKEERRKQARDEEDMDDDDEEMFGGSGLDDGSEYDGDEMPKDMRSSDNDDDDGGEENLESEEDLPEEAEEEYTEDIYGRKRDKHGNIIKSDIEEAEKLPQAPQKYVPPHQRAAAAAASSSNAAEAERLQRLRKNIKGLLNRLSEANLHKIAASVEELYAKNSRYNMNETLGGLLNEALIGRTLANERMVQEHMVLLAYLHATIGSEIGAHFLQLFIEQFVKYCSEITTLRVEHKQLNNLMLILSYMYIFKMYEHRLLLEIIDRLSLNLCEKAVECLLLVFQSVGFKLRKDDPLAFKQMMQSIQKRIAESSLEMKENLRLKFMVDILNAVKNNNLSKIPQFDPELAENLRKRLKAMLRNDKYVVTLNITMEDLLRADQVGKWWIVGSAWSGNINDLGAAAIATDKQGSQSKGQHFSEKLLALAKQQKMNTEERRNIFCIIMSAEDYVDAFEKILHLNLKDQRSIAYVIMHCCLHEKRPNPYYAHLALKFCLFNRKFQLAFQFATWDRINDIAALTKAQLKNMAQFLQHLIVGNGLCLSVMKVVDFVQLNRATCYLMKHVMVGLLVPTASAEEEPDTIFKTFERVTKNAKLTQFKSSLRLFLQKFLKEEQDNTLRLSDEQWQRLQQRIEVVDKLLAKSTYL